MAGPSSLARPRLAHPHGFDRGRGSATRADPARQSRRPRDRRYRRHLGPPDPLRTPGRAGADRAAAGGRSRGHGDRWRRHRLDGDDLFISRPRRADLAAATAAGDPDLHRSVRLRRHSRRARARAGGAACDLRLALGGRLLVSECPLARRRDFRDRAGALSVRLSRGPRDVPDPGRATCRSRADAGRAALGIGAAHHAAAGAACHRRRSRASPSWRRSTTLAQANISACRP